jgi:hypothetical protein
VHNIIELTHVITEAIAQQSGKPTELSAAHELRPPYRTFIILANHGEKKGTRYLVTVENADCTVQEIPFISPQVTWALGMKEATLDVEISQP